MKQAYEICRVGAEAPSPATTSPFCLGTSPSALTTSLYDYQKDGIGQLASLEHNMGRALLADEMGRAR